MFERDLISQHHVDMHIANKVAKAESVPHFQKFSQHRQLNFASLLLLEYIFFIIFFFTLLGVLIFFFIKLSNNSNNMNIKLGRTSTNFVKVLCSLSFFLSMSLLFLYLYLYIHVLAFYNNNMLNNKFFFIPNISFLGFNFTIDFFGAVILLISYFVGLLSFLALDNKFFFKNVKYFFFLNIFVFIIFFYVTSNNILILFLFYELLLIPSFLLIFYISPSRKSTQASLYFVI